MGGFFAGTGAFAPLTLGGGIAAGGFAAQLAFGVGVSLVLSGASDLLFSNARNSRLSTTR